MKFGFGAAAGLSAVVLAGFIALLNLPRIQAMFSGANNETLFVYCAAGIRKPLAKVAKQYEKKYGVKVETQFAGSGELLSMITAAGRGDIYLAASNQYMIDARKLGLIEEIAPLASQHVAITVAKGNPKNISGLEDLLRENVRLSLADPKVAAISRAARKLLADTNAPPADGESDQKALIWDALWAHKITERQTVNAVANDVKTQTADAGIVWDATSEQYPELETIRVPQFQVAPKQIVAAVLTETKQPSRALHFLRFLSAADEGLKQFDAFGYQAVTGDRWEDRPEITVFVGGVINPAVKETIRDFEKREGVRVNATYNGCGVLVGQMKGGAVPDLYFSCDTTFMKMVEKHFDQSTNVATTDMVLIVAKGNPEKIQGLADLKRDELRIGLCNPDKSALGELSRRLLAKPQYDLWDEVYPTAKDQPATADVLVAHVAVGSLDAAIVYRANTTNQVHKLEILEIDDPQARAVQPLAIRKDSPHRRLTSRLIESILSAKSRKRFENAGFSWVGDEPASP